jgi:hypothetical protein
VPEQRILKAPGKASFNPDAAPAEEAAPAQASTPTLAERNADFNRRQTEARQAATKTADEARQRPPSPPIAILPERINKH